MTEVCEYCGEEEGTEKIANPNLDMSDFIDWAKRTSWWMVCKDCKDTIHAQQMLGMMEHMGDTKMAAKYSADLEAIAKRTKKPIMNAKIIKNKDGTVDSMSVEYTGEE